MKLSIVQNLCEWGNLLCDRRFIIVYSVTSVLFNPDFDYKMTVFQRIWFVGAVFISPPSPDTKRVFKYSTFPRSPSVEMYREFCWYCTRSATHKNHISAKLVVKIASRQNKKKKATKYNHCNIEPVSLTLCQRGIHTSLNRITLNSKFKSMKPNQRHKLTQ